MVVEMPTTLILGLTHLKSPSALLKAPLFLTNLLVETWKETGIYGLMVPWMVLMMRWVKWVWPLQELLNLLACPPQHGDKNRLRRHERFLRTLITLKLVRMVCRVVLVHPRMTPRTLYPLSGCGVGPFLPEGIDEEEMDRRLPSSLGQVEVLVRPSRTEVRVLHRRTCLANLQRFGTNRPPLTCSRPALPAVRGQLT